MINRIALIGLAIALASALAAADDVSKEEPKHEVIKLWPNGAPTQMKPKSEATIKAMAALGGPVRPGRVSDISDPTITIYRPEHPNGASVIVAPGGGFMFLSINSEGTAVCQWLNSLGITGVLLTYRTPTRDEKEPFTMPVEDGQRAMGIVRHHAAEWNLDPNRVGILGFSAGGNLVGHMAWDRGPRTYPQSPELDDPRGPNFVVFVYGGGFLNKDDRTKFREGFSVPADAPPCFFLVAHNDKSNPVEACMLYLEYRKHNLPAEVHIYSEGGHGFGMRNDKNPINHWPARCAEWFDEMGLLHPKAK